MSAIFCPRDKETRQEIETPYLHPDTLLILNYLRRTLLKSPPAERHLAITHMWDVVSGAEQRNIDNVLNIKVGCRSYL
jgi:hypothetical protein